LLQLDLRLREGDLTDFLHAYIDRRLRFVLSRFGDRVGQISVRISRTRQSDCRITLELRPFGRVAVQESGPDLSVAIDRATGRIGRLLGRELDRIRDTRIGRESVRFAA
jgi:ribosome-associated translation inhibitor RaiA